MKFTVITSVYNQAKYLNLIFDAMKKQTFKDWELIIADDGSSDNPETFVEEYASKYKIKGKVKFVSQAKKGMRLARIINKAIDESEGDYIVTVMGDSIPDEKLLEEYDKVVEKGVVATGLRVFVKNPRPLKKIKLKDNFLEEDWRIKQGYHEIGMIDKPWRMFTGNNMCISKYDYDRILKERGHYWNEEYVGYGLEDWELAMDLFELGCEFVPVPEALVYHISHAKAEESETNQLNHFKRAKELYEKRGIQA